MPPQRIRRIFWTKIGAPQRFSGFDFLDKNKCTPARPFLKGFSARRRRATKNRVFKGVFVLKNVFSVPSAPQAPEKIAILEKKIGVPPRFSDSDFLDKNKYPLRQK